jgi:hypothetical protein
VALVAFFAFSDSSLLRVRLVALDALRDLAVDGMAGYAFNVAMSALVLPELGKFFRMAVDTGIPGQDQRLMRVLVAIQTALTFEVDLPRLLMALAALLDRLLDFRRVANMAAYTWNVFVSSSGSLYIIPRPGMALSTVF